LLCFLRVKILKFFDADPESENRDGDSSDPGSWIEKNQIQDPIETSRIPNTHNKGHFRGSTTQNYHL
jgi:hypothetical protein